MQFQDYESRHRMRKPFSLTHVEYEDGDVAGLVLALSSLGPIFIVVMQTTLVCSRRDVHTALFLVAQLLNAGVNLVLKPLIGHARPPGCSKTDYGMPSDHSQFMAFFATYVTLLLVRRVKARNPLWAHLVCALAWAFAAVVMVSRVYLGYHYASQVLAGAALGCALGALAFRVNTSVVIPRLRPLLAHPLARWLMIRDLSNVPYVLEQEYAIAARGKVE